MQVSKQTVSSSRLGNANAPRTAQLVRATGKSSSKQADIYIGFPKNDYAPREGRQGRVIKDDPSKYPNKENLGGGLFIGAVGGWAGGEASLLKFREEIKEELSAKPAPKPVPKKASASGSPKAGQKPIYVGFGKDEIDLRNSGAKGRVIFDDDSKYPAKEDLGFLAGATGGFAGGERGVKGFVATGEVKLRKAGEAGGQPMSPLVAAFLVLVAGFGASAIVAQFYKGEGPSLEGLELNILVGSLALMTVAGALLATQYMQAPKERP